MFDMVLNTSGDQQFKIVNLRQIFNNGQGKTFER